ncbi:unnamed protein product [Pipistrellus nathusii]|uniref:Uncharacterized protein n=1 Tax=Pipistrellus nathusii TaxID=59473 RepID=A0ABN9ZFZ7_PIPNA
MTRGVGGARKFAPAEGRGRRVPGGADAGALSREAAGGSGNSVSGRGECCLGRPG